MFEDRRAGNATPVSVAKTFYKPLALASSVGGGLIVGGAPLTGSAGYSGEVGHIPVNPDGLPCRCGSIGCWETSRAQTSRVAGKPDPRRGGP